jgi:hypothetical protein
LIDEGSEIGLIAGVVPDLFKVLPADNFAILHFDEHNRRREHLELIDERCIGIDTRKNGKPDQSAKDRKIAALETKLAAKNEVIAELMEENVKAKKEHGEL